MTQKTPIEMYLETSESKAVSVLLWLLRQRDKDNYVYTTLSQAAKDCGVTKVTINRVFGKLYEAGFLRKIGNGRYQLIGI